ncbi:twin-arginine translocase TatA/TatE family subunit [Pseudescherichia sp.]|uniref:twin-arginine translocase TatA/TatE family subunit n=1 Tax=Pseudescherichia sp. TaxID=2055881 RepID=UPI00289BC704|nr:twin-arginine translocase TatA/TatE family subunit [Pseudescherichia sp.]
MGGISIWQLAIIAVIVVLLFGTKKLGSLGSDLGASIRGFKKAMGEEDSAPTQPTQSHTEALSHAGQDAKNRDTLQS